MQCEYRNLSVLAYAQGFTLWHYTAEKCPTFTDEENFFGPVSDMVVVGDIVFVSGKWGAVQVVIRTTINLPSGTAVAVDMMSSSI